MLISTSATTEVFNFVKQASYKVILTWIFLDTKFIQNKLKQSCMNLSVNLAFVVTTYTKTYGAPPLVNISYMKGRHLIQLTYAIAVLKDDVIIGHLPRVFS